MAVRTSRAMWRHVLGPMSARIACGRTSPWCLQDRTSGDADEPSAVFMRLKLTPCCSARWTVRTPSLDSRCSVTPNGLCDSAAPPAC